MNEIVVNVEGAIRKDDKWLMIIRGDNEEHAAGMLSMVGGSLETEEDLDNALEEALKREILEEVGIEVEDLRYVESKIFNMDNGEKALDVVFLCTYKSGEPRALTDEVAEVLWMTTEEIMSHPKTPPWIKQSIKLADQFFQNL